MGVRYLPDYSAIKGSISDQQKYPDDSERQKLLDIISKNEKAKAKHLDAVRYFHKP